LAQKDVDPAALLIAIFVALSTQVLTPGSWSLSDTIVAIVVLMVIIAYSPPTASQLRPFQRFTAWLVIELICAVAISWPVQYLIARPLFGSRNDDVSADQATGISLLVVLVVSISWLWLINHTGILTLIEKIWPSIDRAVCHVIRWVVPDYKIKDQEGT